MTTHTTSVTSAFLYYLCSPLTSTSDLWRTPQADYIYKTVTTCTKIIIAYFTESLLVSHYNLYAQALTFKFMLRKRAFAFAFSLVNHRFRVFCFEITICLTQNRFLKRELLDEARKDFASYLKARKGPPPESK